MPNTDISREKHPFAIGLVGGPTVVLDLGGLRFVTDPTFDPPGEIGALTKLEGPAVPADALGDVDAVLLSHEAHADNLDPGGREFLGSAGRVLAGPQAAARLGDNATGLRTWETTEVHGESGTRVTVRALPATHGPLDGERDEHGDVNCEVVGFLLSGDGLPTVYVSGDNASLETVAQIASRERSIDVAILFAGAARVDFKERGRPLTLTSERAADATLVLGAPRVVAAHFRGWTHFSEGAERLVAAFDDAGIADRLVVPEPGVWALDEPVA